ncbi:uroporphyrinogen-III C-methyltransferase [Caldimonas thermodepolymerans]|jgi:uroporphyrin-III C-methyltransferase|uniref:uroporphyrinogen-III C-methyltransferase n=1 Tax=Caldimonas thermodepolymerans TaxID=215580 RepID=A0A2S5T2F4_9BURK|nr:uroporphyrinogen-III C-methyltransferase [Caldimonas thermodepolymerans]PPE69195.1 uroporphyrinogen-III C-methyltransferase [Caldimonas thermodepolymerans]QPC32899.1 uroporphyrinogen-III C-methyltransferase [Caldimonas thermodepolymerans]RDI03677.1 uroporphyrinogen-III C-methyltransferase [Caldimonas thermodepolymerans]UZG45769.1 uroporphyrinogen-III C-methyltransferase [Caldimonas thermodepolymerans]
MNPPPDAPSPRPRVTLVGAGPGDPELLTLKAIRAIRAATVLLVDDLVGREVLRYARRHARIVDVGKRGGCRSTPQDFIERLMATEALKGERVVRLKGGDPGVFGRGGEEVEHLRAHGIEVEVINGITSGLAAATGLGVPLTHRDHAHGVILVTGHPRAGSTPLDWRRLATTAADGYTLVIYMGVAQAAQIQAGLLEGLPPDTPVAVVQHASLPQQRHAVAPLADLQAMLQREGLGSPAVIIVGNVLRGLQAVQPAARLSAAAA